MIVRRLIAASITTLSILGVSAVLGQKEPVKPPAGPLDPAAVSVRFLLGIGQEQAEDWSGSVSVDKGDVLAVEGWRFQQQDAVTGANSWTATTRPANAAGKKAAAKKKAAAAKKAANGVAAAAAPIGVIVTLKAPAEAKLTFNSPRGSFTVPVADLAAPARSFLDGRVQTQRVPTSVGLVDSPDQDDFPSAAADPRGPVWVAYVVHKPRGPASGVGPLRDRPTKFADYVPEGGGDQVRLVKFSDGKAGPPIDVTAEGLDVWRPSVAVAGDGSVVVAWSENKEGNFDLYSRKYDPVATSWSESKRLTSEPGADADVALASVPGGEVWMAWQAWRDGRATILLAPIEKPESAVPLSDAKGNAWSPSIAAEKGGRVHVAFDTYQAGNYDVILRSRSADGTLSAPVAVADSANFEARPSVAVDPTGRVWVAFEERGKDWGKDAENLNEGEGITLYRGGAVRVRCVDGARILDAPDPVAKAANPIRLFNSYPRLASDRSGRIWLAFRHRLAPQNNASGGVWIEQATSLSGKQWTVPTPVTRSDGMLDNRPSIVVPGEGPPLIVYDGDGRLASDGVLVENALNIAALVPDSAGFEAPTLAEAPKSAGPAPLLQPNEAADIARLRSHRIKAGGKSYRLLRGEFHRHTEISQDGGNDGSLEEMWRYAIDVAGLDWIGNGDHDNGGHKEYTWWLTQKTTDLYHGASKFTPMFTYERSVVYPHGHRNVMFDRRGIRTLPRLQQADAPAVAGAVTADDTKMLYDYLNELGGITASHTSGTAQMGTDWRDNDPKVEPIVEIFQGHRNSYEHLGAPRVGRTKAEGIAGMQPYGMIWNALALNYKLGFEASSDHISTHISYAVAIAEDHTRAAILDAFRRRHCYAATDNILLDVRAGEHLMGDEFEAEGPVKLKVVARGTRPIARVDIIKDFVYVYSTEPKSDRVEFTWTDTETRTPPLSWYYVRVIQDDGELAWGSPIWVRRGGAAGGE